MHLIKVEHSDKERYQSFVKTNGSFLQDWDWGDFQQSQGKKVFRYLIVEGEEAIGSAQAMQNAGREGKLYIFLPYGPVFKSNTTEQQRSAGLELIALDAEKNLGALFLRIEPMQTLLHMKELHKTIDSNPHQTLVLDLNKDNEKLLAEMHHKTRYNIKVAQKHNVEVKIDAEVNPNSNPFDASAKRAGVRAYDTKYINSMLKFFRENPGNVKAELNSAYHEGDLLASNLMLFWNDTVVYLFGGSFEYKRNMMPAYLLHWQAIQNARTNGFKVYDFWGVETDPNHPWHGFSKFKLGFGGELKKHEGTWDFVIKPAWYNVYKILRTINRKIR